MLLIQGTLEKLPHSVSKLSDLVSNDKDSLALDEHHSKFWWPVHQYMESMEFSSIVDMIHRHAPIRTTPTATPYISIPEWSPRETEPTLTETRVEKSKDVPIQHLDLEKLDLRIACS